MAAVERYLTLLRIDYFSPELGPEFVALLEEHPEWANTVPPLVQGTHKRTRMLQLEGLGEVIAPPLVWARCTEVTYLLLRQGANPNSSITNSYTNKHIIMYCAEDQPWKLPLLFRFGARITTPQSVSDELNENPLTLAYLLDKEVPFSDEDFVEVDTDLSSYWVWKNAFEEEDQLLDAVLERGMDINSMHPLILKLFLCYGLNVDIIKMPNQGGTGLRSLVFRMIIEGIKEKRAHIASFTGDSRSELLQQSYEVLSDLHLHSLNPYWEDKEFWREKLQRDTGLSLEGDLRWRYLQWYASLKLNGQVLTSYQAGLGAALTFYLVPSSVNIKVEVLGMLLSEEQKGLGKGDARKIVRQLFGINGDLSEGLEDAPELYLLRFKNDKRMPSCRYSLMIDEVVVQFDTEDFMYGVLLAVKILGREREELLREFIRLNFN